MIELPSPCLVVLVGAAGSGKSTWAGEHFPGHVVSSDSLRALAGEGEHDLRASVDAFALLDEVVERRMRRRLTTVIDTLGTDAERRRHWWRGSQPSTASHATPSCWRHRPPPSGSGTRAAPSACPTPCCAASWPSWKRSPRRCGVSRSTEFTRSRPRSFRCSSDRRWRARHATSPQAVNVTPNARSRSGSRCRSSRGRAARPRSARTCATSPVAPRPPGFDALYVMDHFRQIPTFGPPWHDMLESWTTLAHLAGMHRHDPARHDGERDHPSQRAVARQRSWRRSTCCRADGRSADSGSGGTSRSTTPTAGDSRRSPSATPCSRTRSTLLPRMWGPGSKPFDGRLLHVPDTSCYPRPLQDRIPILVGGSGERRTLQLVATGADACNLFGDPDVVRRKVEALARHCAGDRSRPGAQCRCRTSRRCWSARTPAQVRALVDATRPPKMSAERHARAVNAGTVDQHLVRVERFVDAGVDHIVVGLADIADAASVDRFGSVIAAARPL